MSPARDLLVPALAAAGHREHDRHRRRRPRREDARARSTSSCSSPAIRSAAAPPLDAAARAGHRALRPGRHRRHRRARGRPHRAAAPGSPTSSRTTCAAVDFYDEDFPWRYTPAAPDASRLRLRPWITLVVLAENEFAEGKNIAGRPLPFITIADASVLPAGRRAVGVGARALQPEAVARTPSELVSPDMNAVLPRVQAILAAQSATSRTRGSCARAGSTTTPATTRSSSRPSRPAGSPGSARTRPRRRTRPPRPGTRTPASPSRRASRSTTAGSSAPARAATSSYLVAAAQAAAGRQARRHARHGRPGPGSNIPGIPDPALGGILRLGGALQVPDADLDDGRPRGAAGSTRTGTSRTRTRSRRALAAFINLPDDYADAERSPAPTRRSARPGVDDDPDPLITSPLYGRWHALTQRLLTKRDGTPAPNDTNWVHRLNLDPRFRVPAALRHRGRRGQRREYMNYAWQQIGDVLDANPHIRRLHLATRRLARAGTTAT